MSPAVVTLINVINLHLAPRLFSSTSLFVFSPPPPVLSLRSARLLPSLSSLFFFWPYLSFSRGLLIYPQSESQTLPPAHRGPAV